MDCNSHITLRRNIHYGKVLSKVALKLKLMVQATAELLDYLLNIMRMVTELNFIQHHRTVESYIFLSSHFKCFTFIYISGGIYK